MIKRIVLAAGVLGFAAFLGSGNALGDDTVTLHSADGQYQLVLPKGWDSTDFHLQNVQIGARNQHKGEYAEVVAERQEDYVGSLQQYAEAKRDTMAMSLDNPRLTPATGMKINGQDALRFELHGQLPGSKVAIGYSLTVLTSKTHYIQVIGWTEDSHFSENRTELENLGGGFSEISEDKKGN